MQVQNLHSLVARKTEQQPLDGSVKWSSLASSGVLPGKGSIWKWPTIVKMTLSTNYLNLERNPVLRTYELWCVPWQKNPTFNMKKVRVNEKEKWFCNWEKLENIFSLTTTLYSNRSSFVLLTSKILMVPETNQAATVSRFSTFCSEDFFPLLLAFYR